MFNYQSVGSPNQVYFDRDTGRYYTQPSSLSSWGLPGRNTRTYLDQSPFSNTNQSQIAKMMAARQPYQYNAPTAAQMFSGMQAPTPFSGMFGGMPSPNMGGMTQNMGMPSFNMGGQGGGQYGAGRFLGGNTGLLGGNSTSMLGT